MIIHYAISTVLHLACGERMFKKKKCPTCGTIKSGPTLDTTFNKRRVTCKNCQRTKVYKS